MLATGNGTVTITAKATDGSGKSASCRVNATVLIDKMWFEISPYVINAGWSVNQGFWYTPDNAKSTAVTWSSGNKQVATVSSDGTVQSNYNWFGTATITAKAKDGGGAWASYVVDVRFIRMDWARIYNPPGRSLNVGEGYGLGVEYGFTGDEASYPHFSWSSSDTSIATVNGGWVTAKKAGTVTITAYAQDGSGCTASCTINVAGSSSSGGGNSSGGNNGNSGGSNNNPLKTTKPPVNNNENNTKLEMRYKNYRLGGLEMAPSFSHDSTFPYDSTVTPTWGDYASWVEWGYKASAAVVVPWLQDAAKMYLHYRDNTGTDVQIDYERAYNEDTIIRKYIDKEVETMKKAVVDFYDKGAGTKFSIIGDMVAIPNGDSENWQKTIGAHHMYAFAQIEINEKTGKIAMNVIFIMEDMYNFNPGMADIESGTPDDVNGRFSTLGWAKEFKTCGCFIKTIYL